MSEIEKMYENCNFEKSMGVGSPLALHPFTAEKQLEIVKMILFSTWWMNLKRLQFSEKFNEGLAQMINELWKDLTEEEKQQVKGILE